MRKTLVIADDCGRGRGAWWSEGRDSRTIRICGSRTSPRPRRCNGSRRTTPSRPRCWRPTRATSVTMRRPSTSPRPRTASRSAASSAGKIYNFWQDADHVRGIWRRTTPRKLRDRQPAVGDGARPRCARRCRESELGLEGRAMRPPGRAALPDQPLRRRRGCGHHPRVRPADASASSRAASSFPRASSGSTGKTRTRCWSRANGSPGDLGRTGYPFIAKRLQRGQPLSSAVEVYRGSPKDGGYGVTPYVLRDAQNRTLVADRPAARHLPVAKPTCSAPRARGGSPCPPKAQPSTCSTAG